MTNTQCTRAILVAGALAGLLVADATAADEAAYISITDPELLARLGFSQESENVFLLEGALASTIQIDEESIVSREAGDSAFDSYGTRDFSTTTVGPADFRAAANSTVPYVDHTGIFCSDSTEGWLHAEVDLPSGARWDGVAWHAFDGLPGDQDIHLELWASCWPPGAGEPSFALLADGKTSGASGRQFLVTAIPFGGVTIDNGECTYYLRVSFDACSGNLHFSRARLAWIRQVSPAPTTATFGDVPTTHPFFQHVEALAASGITGGCGCGNYCPNAPLTRGQMAVFLAKALGLHWPN